MIDTTTERPLAPEQYRVNEWRITELVRHGYSPVHALLMALDPDVDLEQARRLARVGCPPSLAIRILT
jgi:hypothetical protein